jgi:hypothetical protein
MKKLIVIASVLLLSAPAWSSLAPANYQYPIDNKYDATVIGTPTEFSPKLPKEIPTKVYTIKSIDKLPAVFWYDDGLQFSAALQDHKAPLVFNIAGTGAAYNAAKMIEVQKVLYQAGFHVINISSPTYLDFLLRQGLANRMALDDVKKSLTLTEALLKSNNLKPGLEEYLAGHK